MVGITELKIFFTSMLIIVAGALSGCNSAGKTTITSRSSLDISSQSSAKLNIQFDTIKRHKHQSGIDSRLGQELSENLENMGIFSSVDRNTGDVDYLVNIRITKISIINPAARVIFGWLAPRSHISAQVEVLDKGTNASVTSFQVIGYGAKYGIGAQSYGYDDPVREIVSHVTATLRPYVSATNSSKRSKEDMSGDRDGANSISASDTSDAKQPLEIRLEHIQKLLQRGLISDNEAAEQRARILKDL
jgi:ribosomal protein S20